MLRLCSQAQGGLLHTRRPLCKPPGMARPSLRSVARLAAHQRPVRAPRRLKLARHHGPPADPGPLARVPARDRGDRLPADGQLVAVDRCRDLAVYRPHVLGRRASEPQVAERCFERVLPKRRTSQGPCGGTAVERGCSQVDLPSAYAAMRQRITKKRTKASQMARTMISIIKAVVKGA
jgi:hypothetical protein